jgi:hypothetical protein
MKNEKGVSGTVMVQLFAVQRDMLKAADTHRLRRSACIRQKGTALF